MKKEVYFEGRGRSYLWTCTFLSSTLTAAESLCLIPQLYKSNCILSQSISYMAETRFSHSLLQGKKNYLSVFPAFIFFFSAGPTVEFLTSIPFEICNTKLELKIVFYIQNSTHEFFVTERSRAEGEVVFTWIHSRQKLHLLNMRPTVVPIGHLEYVLLNVYTHVHGVVNPHGSSSEDPGDCF